MNLRMVVVSLVALMGVACGGTMEEATEAENTAGVEQSVISGGPCGTNYCGKGTYCCNASCGVCAPLGAACLDVYCNPQN